MAASHAAKVRCMPKRKEPSVKRTPKAIGDGHMGRNVTATGQLVGFMPRPFGDGADLVIRVSHDAEIEIHPK